jgi:hypothetical protein
MPPLHFYFPLVIFHKSSSTHHLPHFILHKSPSTRHLPRLPHAYSTLTLRFASSVLVPHMLFRRLGAEFVRETSHFLPHKKIRREPPNLVCTCPHSTSTSHLSSSTNHLPHIIFHTSSSTNHLPHGIFHDYHMHIPLSRSGLPLLFSFPTCFSVVWGQNSSARPLTSFLIRK